MPRTTNQGGKRAGAGQPTGNRYQRKLGAPSIEAAPGALDTPPTLDGHHPVSILPASALTNPREAMQPLVQLALDRIREMILPDSDAKRETQLAAARDVVLAYAWDKPIVRQQSESKSMVLVQIIDATEGD